MLPVLPFDDVPLLREIAPLTPSAPALAVRTAILPLDDCSENPVEIATLPPLIPPLVSVPPARTTISPPVPLLPVPTQIDADPPRPPVESPVHTATKPLFPLLDVPVDIDTVPLMPE